MSYPNTVHITPNGDNGWSVKSGGSSRAAGVYDTKAEATERGIQLAKNKGAELFGHGKDGFSTATHTEMIHPRPAAK